MASYHAERSADGSSFEQAGSIISRGNSAAEVLYRFTDTRPLPGTSYYRVKAVSRSGESKYSPVVKLYSGEAQPMILIYPNPVSYQLNILVSNAGAGSYNLKISTANGASVVMKSKLQLTDNIVKINTSAFARGIYIVEITNDKGYKLVKKFTK